MIGNGPGKPRLGRPCNGCGLCCVAEPCVIAHTLIDDLPDTGPCPALEWEGGRSWCGLVRRPAHYSREVREGGIPERIVGANVAQALGGVGGACDSSPGGDPLALEGVTAAQYLRGL